MNTTYEDVYELFFNRVINDGKFWNSTLSPEEMKSIAYKRAKPLLNQAVVIITNSTRYDMPIDIISNMDDENDTFSIKLNKIEMELIADIMLEQYLSCDITARINALGRIFSDSEIKVFSDANSLSAFNATIKELKQKNESNIKRYKSRNRDTYKYSSFDYSFNS